MRLARSSEVMICRCSSHWLTPNASTDVAALEHDELLVDLVVELPLPLECEARGVGDYGTFDEFAKLELAD